MPSSVIKAFAYEPEAQILTITFVSGRAYAYVGVPAAIAEGLRLAFAKGEFFNRSIRDRYRTETVLPSARTEPTSGSLF